MKTLKQLADSIGTSKTTVRNRLIELELMHETAKNDKGVIIVPDHVCEILFDSFQKAAEQSEKQAESKAEPEPQSEQPQPLDANALLIETLQQQLTAKDAQITELTQLLKHQQATIDNLSFALNNAQALTAGTLQTFQLTAQQPEQADTSSTPEAEPAQPAAPKAEPPKAADTSGTPSEPPRKPTSNTTPNSYTDTTAQAKSRVQPLRALQSLFNRKR